MANKSLQTALVTGSGKGIGAEIAKHLAQAGVNVAIHYRSSRDAAGAVLSECKDHAPESILVQGDLTDANEAQRVCLDAEAALGSVDILVNNVGNYVRKNLLEMSIDEWRDQIESNLYTSFYTCHVLLPRMMKRGQGRIVNIGYAGSQQAFYNYKTVPYHIAKTGVNMLTRNLGALAAGSGVTVNCLGMGVIENSVRKPRDIPEGRIGEFGDICNALDFVLKPESDYINGTQIDIAGGWLPEQMLKPFDDRPDS